MMQIDVKDEAYTSGNGRDIPESLKKISRDEVLWTSKLGQWKEPEKPTPEGSAHERIYKVALSTDALMASNASISLWM